MKVLDYLRKPVRIDYIQRFADTSSPCILDVGCGNGSPSVTKKYIPRCEYHGLDRTRDYNLSDEDLAMITQFYEIDLSTSNLAEVPDQYFDIVIFSHVIEHLHNGDEALNRLARKVKYGGIIYVETPSTRSLHFPSMPGTLNFFDDKTHVRIYSINEITRVLTNAGFRILRSGVRRSPKRIMLFPFQVVVSVLKYRRVVGSVFWDVLGFASIVVARKTIPDLT